ncbi:MAG: hypothetical protein K1000chlam1_00212 [Candidatus Anoxychlamydiales bacterium]|nr:hypothetical protein [Candidatus Anoxychlamydiales bacterium]
MRFFFTLFLFSSLMANPVEVDQEKDQIISSFKQTLIKKGTKLLDKTKKPTASYKPHELIVDLRNPSYKNGILTTHEGGVIKGEDIRIQARSIQYIKRYENGRFIHCIEAEKDLIIQYKGRVYVGEEFEYDFTTKSGVVYDGKTFASLWYLGGDKIELKSDGSYHVENVYITTCENVDSTWDIHAGNVNVLKKDLLEAKNVRFRFFRLPTLWLPSFKINLKKFFGTPVIRYKVNWDKSSGPKGSLRYRLYSWRDFSLWGRLEYRLRKGWGGAIETEYLPEHGRTVFQTKNYLATDIIPKELLVKKRYRIQGVYHTINPSKTTKMDMVWDKFSDINMPSDFKSDDFELNTAKKTELTIRHQGDFLLGVLYARPRVNSFDTIKQNLPKGYLNLIPYKAPNLNLVFYNYFIASYLDYEFSDKLSPSLMDFESARLETNNVVSRPFKNSFANFTPYAGFVGIFYNKSPSNDAKKQAMFLYGANLSSDFYKSFEKHKHVIQPYVQYQGITEPTEKVDSYYIFSIEDGYNKLNLIKTGIRNQIYSLRHIRAYPTFETNLYANTFLDSNFIPKTLPKIYLDINWNLPSVYFKAYSAWNLFKNTLDYSNFRLGWSVSQDLALSLEFRYRSSYDYRKANHENFILDVSREENILTKSPISDKRNTILTHIFFRLNPFWEVEIHSHHGWNRKNEPAYNEYKIDLFTTLSSSWKVRVSYQHTEPDDRFSGAVYLIK